MNFVNAPSKSQTQIGLDKPWTDKIRQLFPLRIIEIGHGSAMQQLAIAIISGLVFALPLRVDCSADAASGLRRES